MTLGFNDFTFFDDDKENYWDESSIEIEKDDEE